MIDKNLSDINIDDIQELIDNSISEEKIIDFKIGYSFLKLDKDKGEFLADISSFANTSGGSLIFGIKEEEAIAKEIVGFEVNDQDEEIRKIENLIRDGIRPRINVESRFVSVGGTKYVLIVRTAKSWFSPHRVIFNGYPKTKDQFYARNSNGNYQLDVDQLRNAFNLNATLIEMVRNFRIQRISEIIADNTPVTLLQGAKTILHIIPIESFTPDRNFNVTEINDPEKLRPPRAVGYSSRVNLDGFLTFYKESSKDLSHSYVQMYRTGIIEAVGTFVSIDKEKQLLSYKYEQYCLDMLKNYLSYLKELKVNPQILIFLTITGVKGFKMAPYEWLFGFDFHEIDRDVLNLPEHLLQSYDEKPEDILRPMYDVVWNACGHERSYNFDENGNWIMR
ncbi:MAG: ATP-binding protein [Magnetococcales bacterium]|nr:ATP-binding protein [Nitrospirota bacterium]